MHLQKCHDEMPADESRTPPNAPIKLSRPQVRFNMNVEALMEFNGR